MTNTTDKTSISFLQKALNTAIKAADAAAELQLKAFGDEHDIEFKSNEADLVTAYDKASEAIIRRIILETFPDHAFLGEEGVEEDENSSSAYRWIVDPIDGTMNFAYNLPHFCISIALEHAGEMQVGLVYDPVRKEYFKAIKGQGASVNDKPMQMTDCTELRNTVVACGFGKIEHVVPIAQKLLHDLTPVFRTQRRFGASALDLCYLACGRIDAFWGINQKLWDVAAGGLIAEEMGAKFTTETLTTEKGVTNLYIATNQELFPIMHKRIHESIESIEGLVVT